MARNNFFKKINLVLVTSVLLLAFNNCGGQFVATDIGSEGSGSETENPNPTPPGNNDPSDPPVMPPVVIPNPPPTENPLLAVGKAHYETNCAGCHGAYSQSNKRNISIERLNAAIDNIPVMSFLKNANINRDAIVLALEGGEPPVASNNPKYTCDDNTRRGLSYKGNRRLTRFELSQTLQEVFGSNVYNKSRSTLEQYPEERYTESVSEFEADLTEGKLTAIVNLAIKVGLEATDEADDRRIIMPTCMLNSQAHINVENQDCNNTFLNTLGLKILRRPLTNAQLQNFRGILNGNESFHQYNRGRIAAVVSAMMLTPEFLTHMGSISSQAGSKGQVDQYTVASRISYQTTGSLPDAQLFNAARNSQLVTNEQRQSHARRLLNSNKSRLYVRNFFKHLLHISKISEPSVTYGNYIGVSTNGLTNDLRKEALDFVEHIVFEQKGNFKDLMNSNKSFPPSANTAKLFGTSVSSGVKDPKVSSKGHKGVFMRPALMISPEPRTSPIRRGVFFTREVLCNTIPEPDASSVAEGEQAAAELDLLNVTARAEAEHVTKSISCDVCHKHLNPAGFFFERLGSFGDIRDQESIFDQDNFIRKLNIDTRIEDFLIDGVKRDIANIEDFNNQIASSTQGQACFSQNIFRYTRLAKEYKDDDCLLSETEKAVRDEQSILDVIMINATSEDQLWETIN